MIAGEHDYIQAGAGGGRWPQKEEFMTVKVFCEQCGTWFRADGLKDIATVHITVEYIQLVWICPKCGTSGLLTLENTQKDEEE